MPDKIWLHKDTKYNTGDIVCGYQYEFAQEIECEGIENYVEYVNKGNFIDKACEWLENYFKGVSSGTVYLEDFKKAIKE